MLQLWRCEDCVLTNIRLRCASPNQEQHCQGQQYQYALHCFVLEACLHVGSANEQSVCVAKKVDSLSSTILGSIETMQKCSRGILAF
jgi:hypothetical protein